MPERLLVAFQQAPDEDLKPLAQQEVHLVLIQLAGEPPGRFGHAEGLGQTPADRRRIDERRAEMPGFERQAFVASFLTLFIRLENQELAGAGLGGQVSGQVPP